MATAVAEQQPKTEPEFRSIPVEQICESQTNPRRHFDADKLKELADNIRTHGVLEPVLVRPRPRPDKVVRFELVVGARRLRGALLAGLTEIPARVVNLTDDQALEVQVIENLQREDIHALEEAEGYQALLGRKGYSAEKIAGRVNRSPKYVWDRIKLLQLCKPGRDLFLEGAITAGHAILLARLPEERQLAAIGKPYEGPLLYEDAGPALEGGKRALKAISVRELQDWIDDHVRLAEAEAVEPMLFPETALTLTKAEEQEEKVVHITRSYSVLPEAKDERERTFGPQSWKRADGEVEPYGWEGGKKKSKPCDHAVLGVVVVGEGRGEAFKVCTAKKECKVHWAAEQRRSAAGGRVGGSTRTDEQARWKREEELRRAQHQREEAERKRWAAAVPAILEAVAAQVLKAPTKATGLLADVIVRHTGSMYRGGDQLVPRGKSAEDLVRFLAFRVLATIASNTWNGPRDFPKLAKAFGVDVKAFMVAEASCRKCGCTEAKACEGGCSWAEQPDPKTRKGLCSSCVEPSAAAAAAAPKARGKAKAKKASGPLARRGARRHK